MTLKTALFVFSRPSLARRLVVYIFLISGMMALLATAVQIYIDYQEELRILDSRMDQIESTYVKGISADLWNMDQDQIRGHLDGIMSLPDISYAAVDPVDLEPIALGEKSDESNKPGPKRVFKLLFRHKGDVLNLGKLTVEATLDGIHTQLRQRVFVVLATQAIKVFIIAFMLIVLLNALVINPLETIAHYTRQLTLSQLGEALQLKRTFRSSNSNDELDAVVSGLNQMQEALKRSYDDILSTNAELAKRSEELEAHKENLELLVEERTKELREAEQSLLDSAHKAGMAEIAIGVLHHIGNTLNSLNISNHIIESELDKSSISKLIKANQLLAEHEGDLVDFMQNDPKGPQLIRYYVHLGMALQDEHQRLFQEAHKMEEQIRLIREAISSQQEYARGGTFTELIDLETMISEVLRLEEMAMKRANIEVETHFEKLPKLLLPTTKVRYVLMHIIKNAREATFENDESNRKIVIRLQRMTKDRIELSVHDNGIGIASDQLVNIFKHGFTTKKEGHGFGLHTCANAMVEMGGRLSASSPGPGQGAEFQLVFPQPKSA